MPQGAMRFAFSGLNSRSQLSSGASGASALDPVRDRCRGRCCPTGRSRRARCRDRSGATRCISVGSRLFQFGTLARSIGRQRADLDQAGEARLVAWHHDVVAGMAGQQLGLQRLQAVVHVVVDRDAGFLAESLQRRGIDVVGPVVDVQHVLLRARRQAEATAQQGQQQTHA